jgi:UDP-glucuronate decarboxylase
MNYLKLPAESIPRIGIATFMLKLYAAPSGSQDRRFPVAVLASFWSPLTDRSRSVAEGKAPPEYCPARLGRTRKKTTLEPLYRDFLVFNCARGFAFSIEESRDGKSRFGVRYSRPKVDDLRSQIVLGERRVLVTGGAGFIGSHLCERLLERGDEVLCIDNFYTGTRHNVHHLIGHPRFELMRHDVCFPLYVEVNEIYNLACPASPIHYQFDPVQTTKTSVHGAINMLGLAKRLKAKILQASTSEVYGDPNVHPQSEHYWGNVNPIGPRSCYDEGKRCAETLFFDYRRQHLMSIKVARIFNTYGPRMHPADGRVVSNFILQALRNEDITIYGDGSQTRSFCYVDDLVEAMIAFMDTSEEVTGPINLGNPVEFTIRALAEQIIEMTRSSSRIAYHPLPIDDPKQRCPDIRMAEKLLKWKPKIPLTHGLEKTIAYFKKHLSS